MPKRLTPSSMTQSQVELIRGNSTRTLLVRIAAEHNGRDNERGEKAKK